jgi:hypothetical protein
MSASLVDLCREFNELRDARLAACAGDSSQLVYDAVDLDLGTLLAQLLPIVVSLLQGGFTLVGLLPLIKVLVSLLVKDSALAASLVAILETLLKMLVK